MGLLKRLVEVTEGRQLVPSPAREREDVERENNVLALKAAQRHLIAIAVQEREVRRRVAYLHCHESLLSAT